MIPKQFVLVPGSTVVDFNVCNTDALRHCTIVLSLPRERIRANATCTCFSLQRVSWQICHGARLCAW